MDDGACYLRRDMELQIDKSKIKEARLRAGLTQKKAAEVAGVSISSWEHYESGTRVIALPTFRLFLIETGQEKPRYWDWKKNKKIG